MERKFLILLGVAATALLLAFIFQPDPSIRFDAFRPRIRDALQRGGYTILEERSARVPLPFWVEYHPRRWRLAPASRIHLAIGFRDGGEQITTTRDGTSTLGCFVRYLDARACFIEIRAPVGQQPAAVALGATLRREFLGCRSESPIHSAPALERFALGPAARIVAAK